MGGLLLQPNAQPTYVADYLRKRRELAELASNIFDSVMPGGKFPMRDTSDDARLADIPPSPVACIRTIAPTLHSLDQDRQAAMVDSILALGAEDKFKCIYELTLYNKYMFREKRRELFSVAMK